ncbi:MAG TPA: HAD-IA family hydrolase [Ktedonobacterales bacterium]|nr:HAD-IA family hydrolase [Ktedonobacterales bacterium]
MLISALEHPQSIRAVFFDAGYTLLAPHPSIVEIVQAACAARGTPVERACLEAHFLAAEATLRRLAREQPHTWANERAIVALWVRYFTELLRPCLEDTDEGELAACAAAVEASFNGAASYALYPDVLPALDALQGRGFTLGVISDWGIGLGLVLRHHDLVRYFDFAVVSAAVRHAKPDPALFATALRRADAIPDYALHIGDSYLLDVLGARAAGITPVLLDRAGRHDPAALDCLVVRDLYGLLALLDVPRA